MDLELSKEFFAWKKIVSEFMNFSIPKLPDKTFVFFPS